MLKNYLTIALRNLRRHKAYAAINILGLTIGLTCCFLIFSYTQHEYSYNTHLPYGDRTFKIIRETTLHSGAAQFCERTSGPLGNAIREQFSEIEEAVTLVRGAANVQKEGALNLSMTVAETNTNILSFFNLTLLQGHIKKGVPSARTALIISDQLHYLNTKNLGFDKDQVLVLPLFLAARDNTIYGYDGLKLKQKYNTVKQQFLEHPNITAATTSRFLLGGWFTKGQFESEDSGKQTFSLCPVDEDFIPFFNIPLIRGSNFSPSHATLSFDQRDALNRPEQFIINQAAAVQLGLKEPVGKPLKWHNGRSGGTIIGVLKDFHFETLKNTLDPVVPITQQQRLKFLFLKVTPHNFDNTLTFIQKKWAQFIPNRPLEFSFLDQSLNARYNSETRLQQTLTIFTFLALFLSSLGLFGLALFIMTQRTKEIGIRKVLGASIQSILHGDPRWVCHPEDETIGCRAHRASLPGS